MGQCPLVMWSAVCSAPQSQLSGTTITTVTLGQSLAQHVAPNLPTSVHNLFTPLFDGVGMNLCEVLWCRMPSVNERGLCYLSPVSENDLDGAPRAGVRRRRTEHGDH